MYLKNVNQIYSENKSYGNGYKKRYLQSVEKLINTRKGEHEFCPEDEGIEWFLKELL